MSPTDGATKATEPLVQIEQGIRQLMLQVAEDAAKVREDERERKAETRKLLLELLEVIDAFERVFRSIHAKKDDITPQMKIWTGNFRTVRKMLDSIVASRDVVRIENLDSGFDPQWHKVAEVVTDPEKPDGTIVEEVKAGYVWLGDVLRKTEVTVVRNE